jgi:hypothetical protein
LTVLVSPAAISPTDFFALAPLRVTWPTFISETQGPEAPERQTGSSQD